MLTFNGFNLQDSNFITERIVFRGFSRGITTALMPRREGIKILDSEFNEKGITINGVVVASTADELQTLLDNMKKSLIEEEADLIFENGRVFKATVENISVPDEHYNLTKADFSISFACTKPFAEGSEVSVNIVAPSGQYTVSGTTLISGTFFSRPTLIYSPAGASTGNTNINKLDMYFVQNGQTVTISGFGSGLGLDYADDITVNLDNFTGIEGTTEVDLSGGFPEISTGTLDFTITSDTPFVGGVITLKYKPRYI